MLAVVAVVSVTGLTGCGSRPAQPVQDLSGGTDVAAFTLKSLKGTRDGTRLEVQAVYGDVSEALVVHLRFEVNPQARLEFGTWSGPAGHGTVRQRSITFLGGQSGPPSIGGNFDLIGSGNRPLYRVAIPLQPLNNRL